MASGRPQVHLKPVTRKVSCKIRKKDIQFGTSARKSNGENDQNCFNEIANARAAIFNKAKNKRSQENSACKPCSSNEADVVAQDKPVGKLHPPEIFIGSTVSEKNVENQRPQPSPRKKRFGSIADHNQNITASENIQPAIDKNCEALENKTRNGNNNLEKDKPSVPVKPKVAAKPINNFIMTKNKTIQDNSVSEVETENQPTSSNTLLKSQNSVDRELPKKPALKPKPAKKPLSWKACVANQMNSRCENLDNSTNDEYEDVVLSSNINNGDYDDVMFESSPSNTVLSVSSDATNNVATTNTTATTDDINPSQTDIIIATSSSFSSPTIPPKEKSYMYNPAPRPTPRKKKKVPTATLR